MAERAGQAEMAALGSFVRERRKLLGLTQTQLGERLGYVQERISLIENGKYGLPALPALIRIAEALEVSLPALLSEAGYVNPAPFPTEEPAAEVVAVAREQRTADFAAAEFNGEFTAQVRYLSRESGRLAVSIEDLQGQVQAAQNRIQALDALRDRLRTQRLEFTSAAAALRDQTSAREQTPRP